MNNEPGLSAEARRVIAEARGFDDPTEDDRQRVKARWLAGVAAAAGVSALGEAARAASSTGWGVKALTALAVAAGAAGLYALFPDPAPAPEPAAVQTARGKGAGIAPAEATLPPAAVVPVIAPVPSEAEPSPEEASEEPVPTELERAAIDAPSTVEAPGSARAASPRPTARAWPPRQPRREVAAPPEPAAPSEAQEPAEITGGEAVATDTDAMGELAGAIEPAPPGEDSAAPPQTSAASRQLGEEAALLSQIRGSLRAGSPERALDLLGQYRARFAAPMLEMEAAALRVDALCQSGDLEGGRAEAARFQITWPSSPLVRRVRAACP